MKTKINIMIYFLLTMMVCGKENSAINASLETLYFTWQEKKTIQAEDIAFIDQSLLTQMLDLYRSDYNSYDLVPYLWYEPLKSLSMKIEAKEFLTALATTGGQTYMPSISHAAWIVLVEKYMDEELVNESFHELSPAPDSDCPVGYLYALSILAEVNDPIAIERLAHYTIYDAIEEQFCAEIAARGLVVAAFRDNSEAALQAIENFNLKYIKLNAGDNSQVIGR